MIERIYRCDGPPNPDLPGADERPDEELCPSNQHTFHDHAPTGWLTVIERGDHGAVTELYFCNWNCVLRFASKIPPPEIIEWEPAA